MAKLPIETAGALIGWFDDLEGFVGAHLLRQRYRAAYKHLKGAERAVRGCMNTRRLPVLKEEFERARLHLEEVESEVKRCW